MHLVLSYMSAPAPWTGMNTGRAQAEKRWGPRALERGEFLWSGQWAIKLRLKSEATCKRSRTEPQLLTTCCVPGAVCWEEWRTNQTEIPVSQPKTRDMRQEVLCWEDQNHLGKWCTLGPGQYSGWSLPRASCWWRVLMEDWSQVIGVKFIFLVKTGRWLW